MNSKITLPPDLVTAWEKAVLAYSPRARSLKFALEMHQGALRQIWQVYTQERTKLGRLPFTDVRLVGPYLLGFHLPNAARFLGVLERAFARGWRLPDGEGPIRVMDLGSGTGAGSQGVWTALRQHAPASAFEFELVDRSRHLVDAAKQVLSELAVGAKVRSLARPLEDSQTSHLMLKWLKQPTRLNILALGYVWNELSSNPRLRGHLLEMLQAWSETEKPTWLLLTEPATEESARRAIDLRDNLVQMGWQVAYPCLASQYCPMGSEGRDWCYSEFEFNKPAFQMQIEKSLGVSRQTLGSAAYLMVNSAAASKRFAPPPLDPRTRTVVGRPQGRDGDQLLLLCDGEKLEKKLSRDRVNRGLTIQ